MVDGVDAVPESGPLTMEQAYVVLELGDGDKGNLEKVKMAYRKLCLKWHPDKNPKEKEEEAKQRFTRVTAAYHTITTNNFDFQRWARSYSIPPMQGLEDVLKMALSGRDPFEIEAMLRARGDYRPHGNFGVDVNIPWSAGEKHDQTFDVPGGSVRLLRQPSTRSSRAAPRRVASHRHTSGLGCTDASAHLFQSLRLLTKHSMSVCLRIKPPAVRAHLTSYAESRLDAGCVPVHYERKVNEWTTSERCGSGVVDVTDVCSLERRGTARRRPSRTRASRWS